MNPTLILRRRTDARWAEGDEGGETVTDGPERDTDRKGNIKVKALVVWTQGDSR